MPLIKFKYENHENVGGLACSTITFIAIEDIVSQTAATVTYMNAYEMYFTEGTAQHNEKQKRTKQGDIFEQSLDFVVPKRRQDIREWIDQNARKYFYVQYTDANGQSVEIPIMQLLTDSTTGRQASNRNETTFSLDGVTLKKAKVARTAIESQGIAFTANTGLFFDLINDDVILPEILTRFIETNTDFSISLIFFQRTIFTEHFIYHAYRFGVLMYDGYFSFRADDGGGVYWENYYPLPLPPNTLHHIIITNKRGQPNGFKLYKNGVLMTTQNAFNHNTGTLGQNYTGRLSSRNLNSSGHSGMNMHDIMIWDKELTPEEVANVFNYIMPFSAMQNLKVKISAKEIFVNEGFPALKEEKTQLFLPLSGYASGAKGIVDVNNNDIQLVP